MALIWKAAGAALTASLLTLLLRQKSPEFSLLLSVSTVCILMLSVMGFAAGIRDLAAEVKTMTGSGSIYMEPVLKCVAIGYVSKITGEICRQASQAAAASMVELAGTVCAMSVVMPLILSMLHRIGGLL